MKKTAKSTQDIKAIKAALQLDGTLFNLKGQTSGTRNEKGEWVQEPEVFKTTCHITDYGDRKKLHAFKTNHILGSSMNVKRFGSTKVSLYTITPFGKIVKQTLFYADITIVEAGKAVKSAKPVKMKKRKGPRVRVINNLEIGGEAWLSQ